MKKHTLGRGAMGRGEALKVTLAGGLREEGTAEALHSGWRKKKKRDP